MDTSLPNSSKKEIKIIFSIFIIIMCYIGAWIAVFDMTKNVFWATILAAFACLDFAFAYFLLNRPASEPSDVWYWFGAILLVGAFSSTLVWWSLGVASIQNEIAVMGAASVFILRLIVVNILGGDDDHGFLM